MRRAQFLGQAARFLERTLTRKTFPKYLETIKHESVRAWRQYGMHLIPGVELTKNHVANQRSAHIVVLGATRFISADQDIHALLTEIKAQGALSIAAHPVNTGRVEAQTYYLWSRREELRDKFDAWEVASGPNLFSAVLNSGLPMIANSDLHHPRQITSWKTVLHCPPTTPDIFAAIRRQELEFRFYRDPLLDPKARPVRACVPCAPLYSS